MSTAHHLRIARERAGLTQAQLASLVGCSQSDISKYESGTVPRRLDVASRLADELRIPRDEVIFGPASNANYSSSEEAA
ncbi:helix-turn-helix transcriptional regulator [Stenotrophomonas indicatrix]|uniref:helix-turn-helix transcriptional regulator n=1 Tax=Stenotrophomonas indicatrix TaxID=2045451 RepID=UPI001AA13BA1|nr:helix-turn-helix transcriptional regulator [Stenotrophomonas indicatrix]MBO1748926.1 helix-turn-helix transcriptional regulator [Stenotrophomonas indicatrix]